MEILKMKDVMSFLGVGRKTATRILNMPGCPVLPRYKGQTFLVPKDAFESWLKAGNFTNRK